MTTSKGAGGVYFLIIYLSISLSFSILVYSNPIIFNFGDSLSDTGGYVAATGTPFIPPYGRSFFQKPPSRVCDGRVLIDFLCESLNTSYLTTYLHSMGRNYTNGVNFAIYNSCTLPKDMFFNLNVQVLQFSYFQSLSLQLSAQGGTNYVDEEGFKNALYIVDIGGNDLKDAFDDFPYEQAIQRIPLFVAQIKNAILSLYEYGARKFWIPNSHPIGCLPGLLALLSYNASDVDQYGCLGTINEMVTIFNEELRVLCEELRSELQNTTIVYVDIYAIRLDLIANSTSYDFEDPLMACCGYGGPPYNYNSSITCGVSGYDVCEEGSSYVNWDGFHYTEAANAFTAAKILTANYNTPPLNFDFFVTSTTNYEYGLKKNVMLDSSSYKSFELE